VRLQDDDVDALRAQQVDLRLGDLRQLGPGDHGAGGGDRSAAGAS
jgi:hypothetical protein